MSEATGDALAVVLSQIETTGPAPGSRWRHRKGGLYEVVCCAIREEDLVPVVVYRPVGGGAAWDRLLTKFIDGRFTQDGPPLVDHGLGPRAKELLWVLVRDLANQPRKPRHGGGAAWVPHRMCHMAFGFGMSEAYRELADKGLAESYGRGRNRHLGATAPGFEEARRLGMLDEADSPQGV